LFFVVILIEVLTLVNVIEMSGRLQTLSAVQLVKLNVQLSTPGEWSAREGYLYKGNLKFDKNEDIKTTLSDYLPPDMAVSFGTGTAPAPLGSFPEPVVMPEAPYLIKSGACVVVRNILGEYVGWIAVTLNLPMQNPNAKKANTIIIFAVAGLYLSVIVIFGILLLRFSRPIETISVKNSQLTATNESLSAEVLERKLAEEYAKALAAEKQILLRELQHRVKNSMTIIASIANIEARQSPAPEAREALEKLESRISALASLYDILYFTGDIEQIGLGDYLRQVVDYVAEGLGADTKGIALYCYVESVRIDVKRAISIGLVVNELVTDSIKYAFPEGGRGKIEVHLERKGNELILWVEDNGVGLPLDLDTARTGSFGLTLVRSLAAQLDAEFSIKNEVGVKFELRLPFE
jgi:two-component sensor histidine kinase